LIGYYQFVTFRTQDSLDEYIKYNGLKAGLEDWEDRFYGIYDA